MRVSVFTIALFWACWQAYALQMYQAPAESVSCSSAEKEIKATVAKEREAEGFSLLIAPVPSLQEALIALQVSASSAQEPAVQAVNFCEVTTSTFHLTNGHVTGSTVAVDREPPRWLIGLAPDGKKFLLAGFPDVEKDFNELIETVGLQVANADIVRDLFDFYLRLTGGEVLRASIVVDDMQLQSLALEDFRLRYSLPKARSLYAKWWGGIGLGLKRKLHRPEVTVQQNGFKVSYFEYHDAQILQQSVAVSNRGAVTRGTNNPLYAVNLPVE